MGEVIELRSAKTESEHILDALAEKAGAVDMEWLVFQLCLRGPDAEEAEWVSVHPEDLPQWVMDPECVKVMRTGQMVCGDPTRGRLWYRVRLSAPPKGSVLC